VESLQHFESIVRAHNQKRIQYLRSCLVGKKRDVFDLIPFLLHEDNEKLIGNMHTNPPAGIACFTYSLVLKNLVLKYFPRFQNFDESKPARAIEFLALIGSAGTIAYTEESDLDFWVGIHMEKFDSRAIARLREKLSIIENWAQQTAGIETHFFPVDPAKIHDDNFGGMSRESCGSALGGLLKDEFYRTGILLEGRLPLYWIVPFASTGNDYQTCAAALVSNNGVDSQTIIDLGDIRAISVSEYFGAALWQILKGLGSPFKSTLKMALLDMYSASRDSEPLLCELFKRAVHASPAGPMHDPYLFLVDSLRSFYERQGMPDSMRLVERCFLVRILISLKIGKLPDENRLHKFLEIARRWQWSEQDVETLANVPSWEIHQHEAFNRLILEFLIESYRRIRDKTRDAPVRITDRDFTIVGKKLKSFFENSPGKVPFEFSFFKAGDVSRIDIEELAIPQKGMHWQIRLSIGAAEKTLLQMVRPMPNPLVACAWCSINGLYNHAYPLRIQGKTAITDAGLTTISQTLMQFFPGDENEALTIDGLLNDTVITHCFIMPNWNDPEWTQYIKSVFVFYRNSLGEIFYESVNGKLSAQWVLDELLGKRVGIVNLRRLAWKVSISTGKVSSTRRVSDMLTRAIEKFVEAKTAPAVKK
jgi:adenylate cyclase class 1